MLGTVISHDPAQLALLARPVLLSSRITPVIGRHLFLCVAERDGRYAWAPIFSRCEHRARVPLDLAQRQGFWSTFDRPSCIDLRQWWISALDLRFTEVRPRTLGSYPLDRLTYGTHRAAALAIRVFQEHA